MGVQGSTNDDFGQFAQFQLCVHIFGSDKMVLAQRPLGLTMLSHAGVNLGDSSQYECTMGLQGSRNDDFRQFAQFQLSGPIFGSDKVVLACRLMGLNMRSHVGGPSG